MSSSSGMITRSQNHFNLLIPFYSALPFPSFFLKLTYYLNSQGNLKQDEMELIIEFFLLNPCNVNYDKREHLRHPCHSKWIVGWSIWPLPNPSAEWLTFYVLSASYLKVNLDLLCWSKHVVSEVNKFVKIKRISLIFNSRNWYIKDIYKEGERDWTHT